MVWGVFGGRGGSGAMLPRETVATADVIVGGQPRQAQLEALAAAGYRTVVDTRHPAEPRGFDEKALVRRLGMNYANIPMVDPVVPDRDFQKLRDILARPENRPAVLHCASGNRVSGLLIPWLILDEGKSPDQALRVASDAGLRNGYLAQQALDYVRRAGGTDGEDEADVVNG